MYVCMYVCMYTYIQYIAGLRHMYVSPLVTGFHTSKSVKNFTHTQLENRHVLGQNPQKGMVTMGCLGNDRHDENDHHHPIPPFPTLVSEALPRASLIFFQGKHSRKHPCSTDTVQKKEEKPPADFPAESGHGVTATNKRVESTWKNGVLHGVTVDSSDTRPGKP